MKHNFKIFSATALLLVLAVSSCTKKIDEAYINPNAAVRQPVELIFPAMIGTMLGNGSGAANSFGLTLVALIKIVARSSRRPSIPCMRGTIIRKGAMPICRTFTLTRQKMSLASLSNEVYGLPEHGLYKSSLRQVTSTSLSLAR